MVLVVEQRGVLRVWVLIPIHQCGKMDTDGEENEREIMRLLFVLYSVSGCRPSQASQVLFLSCRLLLKTGFG